MKTRTVQPLPRYVRRKWRKGEQIWAYYFEPPTWARHTSEERGPCPVGAEELGTDYAQAVRRAEGVLLPCFDAWRKGMPIEPCKRPAAFGTLNWLFSEYRNTDKYRGLSKRMRKLHEDGFKMVGTYVLKDGRALGAIQVSQIDTGVVDPLYEKLLFVRDKVGEKVPLIDAATGKQVIGHNGEPAFVERRTSVNHAMKSCRRAWNVARRLHPQDVPHANPFSRMGLRGSDGMVPEATYAELVKAVAQADAEGMPSLAAAMMLTWEWLQREEHVFTAFMLEHYRPKDRPNEVKIVHPKNGESVWVPLYDQDGTALFPELMIRLDGLRKDRVGGLMFVRDWIDRRAKAPVPWVAPSGDLTFVRKTVKDLIIGARLRPELTFTSFRHGGLTELGDSDLTDAQIRALSRQKSSKVLPRYIKRTHRQIIAGTHKRRAVREGPQS